jgi:hypothetical protein
MVQEPRGIIAVAKDKSRAEKREETRREKR